MPNYLFQHPETGETKEVFQHMNDPHIYSENGVSWNRIFTIPTASIDTAINPLSHKDWNEKTQNKRGTIGDMMDRSKELSEQREKIMGKDPVREKYFEDYRKKSRGKYHHEDPRKEQDIKKSLDKLGVEVSDD